MKYTFVKSSLPLVERYNLTVFEIAFAKYGSSALTWLIVGHEKKDSKSISEKTTKQIRQFFLCMLKF